MSDELTPEDFSALDTTAEEPKGEPSAPEEPKTVPLGRFQEVYKNLKEVTKEVEALKERQKEGATTPEQDKELQAKQYLKGLLKETLKEQEETSEREKAKEETQFAEEVDEVLTFEKDIKKDDFLKFIEDNSEKYGITSVKGALQLYKDFGSLSKEELEKAKKELARKPGLPKSDGGSFEKNLVDDSHKTLQQIAEEAAKSIK